MTDHLPPGPAQARLFPLPNLVLFPHVLQPLHIFEPRYRQMTADALADDRRIAMALPRPGWEKDYAGAVAIHPVACLGRIVSDERLADGRFNILLRGLSRVRVLDEVAHDKLYRLADVQVLEDVPITDPDRERDWRRALAEAAPDWFPGPGAALEQFRTLLRGELTLGALSDIIAFALPLDAEFKQTLLAELDVDARLRRLFEHLPLAPAAPDPDRPFPPDFSVN